MKHTSRKKMLLSSVAMLLVAMLALGSATFAWFVSNPTATAKGLTVETTTATGLLARSQTELDFYNAKSAADSNFNIPQWGHDTILRAKAFNADTQTTLAADTDGYSLQPVSGGQTGSALTKFYAITAAKDDEAGADTDANVAKATTGAIYSEKVYLKLSDSTATQDEDVYLNLVKMKRAAADNSDIYKAIRVAVYGTDDTIVGTYGLDTAGNLYLTGEGAYAANKSSSTYAYQTAVQDDSASVWTTLAAGAVKVGAVGADGADAVTVVVYLDGEDTECYSRNVVNAQDLIKDIDISFTLTKPTDLT